MQLEQWKSPNIAFTLTAIDISAFIWIRSNSISFKLCDKRFKAVRVVPLSYYSPSIFLQQNTSLTFSIHSSLNNAVVWTLYLLFVIIPFMYLEYHILPKTKPRHVITNCRWDKIKESYMSFMAEIEGMMILWLLCYYERDCFDLL